MKLVPMKHNDPTRTGGPTTADVPEDAVPAYQSAGWFVAESGQGKGEDKPTKHLSQMNKAELDDYAAHLGVEFPENVNTNPEKAAFIKTHLEPGNA